MRHTRIAFVAAFGWCVCLHGGQLARSGQVGGSNPQPERADVCTDSQGGTYSPGAEVEVGGKRMECVIGPHWVPAGSAATDSGHLSAGPLAWSRRSWVASNAHLDGNSVSGRKP